MTSSIAAPKMPLIVTPATDSSLCYRQTLGATQRTKWDTIANGYARPRSLANFATASRQYINDILGQGAAMKQRGYLDRKDSKPYDQTPQEVWNRLEELESALNPSL